VPRFLWTADCVLYVLTDERGRPASS